MSTKKLMLAALGLTFLLTAMPAEAVAPHVLGFHRSVFRGGFHGARGGRGFGWRGWGWGWGWGGGWGWGWWGWPYYAPYSAYYGPDGAYGPYSSYGAAWAVIDTDVSPDEARVYLDGRYIGISDDFDGSPDYLYLRRGHYRLEFKLDGYETKTVEIDAQPGRKLQIEEKLHKIPGSKRYGSYETPTPEGGVRRFFGKRAGSPQTVPEEEAAPPDSSAPNDRGGPPPAIQGEGRSETSGDDGWRAPDKEKQVSPPPRAGSESGSKSVRSRLRLHVEPADAAVYVDDHFVGTAEEVGSLERGIAVSPGKHTVTASRPGYRDRSVDVEVGPGESQPVEVALER